MKKVKYFTSDLFERKSKKYYKFCLEKAKDCGLGYLGVTTDTEIILKLWGSRAQFLKYYWRTFDLKEEGLRKHLKHIVTFLIG